MDAKELKGNKPIGVTRMGEELVLWKSGDGQIRCLRDPCCHRSAARSAGQMVHDTPRYPFHGFAHDGSGRVVLIPANGLHCKFDIHTYVDRWLGPA